VLTQLPRQLPFRLTTLQQACTETVFAANPYSCPAGSLVGTATATTPVLAGKLIGPAYMVSHGGAAFPDLDLVVSGDGVRVILVGNTNIKGSLTTTTFAAVPDIPISSFALSLPMGAHSLLGAPGSLCKSPLVMPTTITAQNGKKLKQNTTIAVPECPVAITGHKIADHTVILTVRTPAAGRISGSGANLATSRRKFGNAQIRAGLYVRLSSSGLRKLASHRSLKVRVRVGFIPKAKGPTSKAFVTVTFRR
jgi:hypothetical protein